MLGFGPVLYLWRIERTLTQAGLAHQAGLPRPTISALERGALDPTLRTVRRLAAGLQVRPGALVDGDLPPRFHHARPMTRASVERLVAHLQGRPARLTVAEHQVAPLLREILKSRLALAGVPTAGRGSARREQWSWLVLTELLGREQLQAIAQRLEKRAQGVAASP